MPGAIRRTALHALAAVVFSSLIGCSSTQPVDTTPDSTSWNLSIGDNIIVTTRDGEEHEFVLLDIDDDFLIGEGMKVAKRDVVKIERHVYEKGATWFATFAVLLAIVVFLITAMPIGMS